MFLTILINQGNLGHIPYFNPIIIGDVSLISKAGIIGKGFKIGGTLRKRYLFF